MKSIFKREGPNYYCHCPPFIWSAAVWRSLDEKYHFLTPQQLKFIDLLDKQGKKQDVIINSSKAFTDALNKQKEDVGELAETWQWVVRGVSDYLNSFKKL